MTLGGSSAPLGIEMAVENQKEELKRNAKKKLELWNPREAGTDSFADMEW